MAYDLLKGMTSGDWARSTTMGALPKAAEGYAPESWITAAEAETKVQSFHLRDCSSPGSGRAKNPRVPTSPAHRHHVGDHGQLAATRKTAEGNPQQD